jgi:hypothetical protein
VAIVQQLLSGEASAGGAHQPYGPLALDNVEVDSDGCVRCTATAATPSVYEAAVLLQALLSHASGVVPGALRYTLGRALLEVEAPPFDSGQHFAAALQRFESESRAGAIAALAARASTAQTVPHERRRATATAAALRRELRDADLRLCAATAASGPVVRRPARRTRSAPISACVITGAALICAGSVASTNGPHQPLPTAARSTAPPSTVAHDIALAPERSSPTPALQPRATFDTPGRTASAVAHNATARRVTKEPRRSRQRTPLRARTPPKRDDADRGVIARIRFEWDNPFR